MFVVCGDQVLEEFLPHSQVADSSLKQSEYCLRALSLFLSLHPLPACDPSSSVPKLSSDAAALSPPLWMQPPPVRCNHVPRSRAMPSPSSFPRSSPKPSPTSPTPKGPAVPHPWTAPVARGPPDASPHAFDPASGRLAHLFDAIGTYVDKSVPLGTLAKDLLAWSRWFKFCLLVTRGYLAWRMDVAANSGADAVGHDRETRLISAFLSGATSSSSPGQLDKPPRIPPAHTTWSSEANTPTAQHHHGLEPAALCSAS